MLKWNHNYVGCFLHSFLLSCSRLKCLWLLTHGIFHHFRIFVCTIFPTLYQTNKITHGCFCCIPFSQLNFLFLITRSCFLLFRCGVLTFDGQSKAVCSCAVHFYCFLDCFLFRGPDWHLNTITLFRLFIGLE